MTPTRPEWLLVDGSSLIFRAFFGVPRTIRAPDGTPVNAVRGFCDYLARFITLRQPRRALVAADVDWRPQWRVELMPSYKTHRLNLQPEPDLERQIPIIAEVMEAVGIPMLGAAGYEAEDVIATVAARANGLVEVVSGDRDLFALVRDPDVRVLFPEGKGQLAEVDEAAVSARYGIPGRSYLDFAILRGDPSDGLPGLAGVGPKKAAELLRRYGSVSGMLDKASLNQLDADYLRRALKIVTPDATLSLNIPDSVLPPSPAQPEWVDELKRAYALGGALDRLLRALAGATSV